MTNELAIEELNSLITDLKWYDEWTEERAEAIEMAINALSRETPVEDLNFE